MIDRKKTLLRFNYFLLIVTTFVSTIWGNFYYLSSVNVDFRKYYDYLNYFMGLNVDILYGQGALYYFLISTSLKRKLNLIDEYIIDIVLSYSVQNINLIFYLIGLFGLYKLFKLFEFETNLILVSLSILNFLPQTIYMRSVMKPEIIAFSFFPWALFFIEKFKRDLLIKNLISSLPFLLIIIYSKTSLAGMALVTIIYLYFDLLWKIEIKKIIMLLLAFIIAFAFLQYENYQITDHLFFEREYDPSYDYQNKFSSLLKVNISEVFMEPYINLEPDESTYSIHAGSVINIVILDSFGDYFTQLFDFDLNYFFKNRKDVFISGSPGLINENRQINYSGPFSEVLDTNLNIIRKALSSTFSIIFYFFLMIFIFKDKKFNKYYSLPFVGILILFINSLGFPSNNYSPYLGDTFKTFYYGFLLSISFVLLIMRFFKKTNLFIYIFSVIWIFSILFIGGHPKKIDQQFSEYLTYSNTYSIFCEINKIIFFDNQLVESLHPSGNIDNQQHNCNPKIYDHSKSSFESLKLENSYNECIREGIVIKEMSAESSCRYYLSRYILSDDFEDSSNDIRYPYFAIINLFTILFLIIYNTNLKLFFRIDLYRNIFKNEK